MRAGFKRWFKRLLKMGGLFVLLGFGVIIGLILGLNVADARQTVVIRGDLPFPIEERVEIAIDDRFDERIEHRIEEQINIEIPPIPTIPPVPTLPPMPEIPPIPEIPDIPDIPDLPTTIHIERGPTFFDIVNGIGTILASLGLIALGVVMIVRGRRQPNEKSPESLNK